MSTRIYYVAGPEDGEYLVRASSQAQAIRRVTDGEYSAAVAEQETILRLGQNGVLDATVPRQVDLVEDEVGGEDQ